MVLSPWDAVWIVPLMGAIAYYSTPIFFAFVIYVYESLLKFDAGKSVAAGINSMSRIMSKKILSTPISILPSSPTRKLDHDSQAEMMKLETPMNVFINVNRAFLYTAFFLSVFSLFPFSSMITFPAQIYVTILSIMTDVVVYVEPIFIPTLLILSQFDKIIDVASDLVKLVKA